MPGEPKFHHPVCGGQPRTSRAPAAHQPRTSRPPPALGHGFLLTRMAGFFSLASFFLSFLGVVHTGAMWLNRHPPPLRRAAACCAIFQ